MAFRILNQLCQLQLIILWLWANDYTSLVFLFGNLSHRRIRNFSFPFMNVVVKPQNLLKLHFRRIISFLPKDSPMWFFLSS